jgi:3'-phosphoadenosine 5'-phosphosulfate (PAPS) 3'-phosphatase
VADYGAQAVVNSMLQKDFTDDGIVGEEDANALRDNDSMLDRVTSLSNQVLDWKLTKEQVRQCLTSMENVKQTR